MILQALENNDAIIIAPKPAMIDWVNSIFPDSPMEYLDPLGHDNSTIYLIPESNSDEDALKWLKKNYKEIFIEELTGWCIDESTFPPITWKKFEEFCIISYQSVVRRLVKG